MSLQRGIARTLKLEVDGDIHEVRTNPGDYLAWVNECNGGVEPEDEHDFTYRDLCWLAWHVATRLGLTGLSLDEFLAKSLDDLEVDVPPGTVRRR